MLLIWLSTLHFSCVIRGYPFYVAVLLPTAAILLVNVVVLILVMHGLTKGRSKLKVTKTRTKEFFGQARIAFACSLVLGLTWLFAVLAVGELTDTFQWLFCIFNSFQGFFIFIFYTARNNDAKTGWKRILGMKSRTYVVSSKAGNRNCLVELKQKKSKCIENIKLCFLDLI